MALNTDQKYILFLLRRAFGISGTGEAPEPEDIKETVNMIRRSGILLTVYPAVKALAAEGSASAAAVEQLLRDKYMASLRQAMLQDYEGRQVIGALNEAGIDCVPLKGWVLRELYPERTMRQMADLDIIVRDYKYSTLKKLFEKLGFAAESESSWKHDSFKKNEVHVEMHKRLTDDSGEIRDWEKGIWSRAACAGEPHVFRMSPEDFYVFHFVHLHKDFMNGSLGLRRLADTWLLKKAGAPAEGARETLTRFGIWTFHERMVAAARAAMGEAEADEDSEILLEHAFSSGIFGNDTSYKAGRIAAMSDGSMKSGKLRSFFAAVFLPYDRMKAQFPVLEKWPVLLPFCWIKRIFGFLGKNFKSSKEKLDYSKISQEDYEAMRAVFKAGGVISGEDK